MKYLSKIALALLLTGVASSAMAALGQSNFSTLQASSPKFTIYNFTKLGYSIIAYIQDNRKIVSLDTLAPAIDDQHPTFQQYTVNPANHDDSLCYEVHQGNFNGPTVAIGCSAVSGGYVINQDSATHQIKVTRIP